MEDENGYTRRTFVAGALAGLAGCSTGAEEETTTSESNYTESSEDSPTGEKDTNDTETGDGSDGGPNIIDGEDEVHDGEEFYESFLDENNFYWVELEQPSSQTENVSRASSMTAEDDFEIVELMLTENEASLDGSTSNTIGLDTLYIAFPGESMDMEQLSLTGLVESEYTEGDGFGQSNGLYGARLDDTTIEEVEGFLEEHITGYSDVSNNFSEDYLNLVSE